MNLKIVGVFLLVIVAVVVYEFSGKPIKDSPDIEQQLPPQQVSQDSFVEVSQISQAMSGMTKETRGIVTVLNEGKGNVYFTLKDPNAQATIKCVLFAKTNNDDPERKEMLLKSRDNNSVLYLKGEVDIYKGELELKTWQVYEKP